MSDVLKLTVCQSQIVGLSELTRYYWFSLAVGLCVCVFLHLPSLEQC